MQHIKIMLFKRFYVKLMDSLFIKSGATIVAGVILSLPIFGQRNIYNNNSSVSVIAGDWITNLYLLLNISKAVERIVYSYNKLKSLSYTTTSVEEMHSVLSDIELGIHKQSLIKSM